MTTAQLAFYAANAAACAMEAQAARARAKAEALCYFVPAEARAGSVNRYLSQAEYLEQSVSYWTAKARGEDPDLPHDLGEGAGVESTQACAPVAVIEPGGRAA